MSETDLKDTLAALSEAATQGEWLTQATDTEGPDYGVGIVADNLGGLVAATLPWPTEIDSGDFSRVEANATFIVALVNAYRSGQLVPVPSVEVVAQFQIGDKVNITAPDWQNEPPHYITGIDWHPKHGLTYTTSEVWPPKVGGFHVEGLTDGWRDEDLSPIAAMKGEGRGDG